MKTFYSIVNYVEQLVSALVSNTQSEELQLKPARIKVEECPYNRGVRTEDWSLNTYCLSICSSSLVWDSAYLNILPTKAVEQSIAIPTIAFSQSVSYAPFMLVPSNQPGVDSEIT